MTTGKTIALTQRTFVDIVMALLFNMLSRLVITFLSRGKREEYPQKKTKASFPDATSDFSAKISYKCKVRGKVRDFIYGSHISDLGIVLGEWSCSPLWRERK